MKKVNINSSLKNVAFSINSVYNLIGKLDEIENKLKYIEDEIEVTISYRGIPQINRIHPDYSIELRFIKDEIVEGKYVLNESNSYLDLKTFTKHIKIEEKSIHIKYDLTIAGEVMEDFEYNVEWR